MLLIALVLSSAMIGSAWHFNRKAQQDQRRQQQQLTAARGQFRAVDEEKRILDEYLPRFTALQAAGFIGTEQRLDWLESLRDAAMAVKLPSLRYQIASRTGHEHYFPLDTGAFRAYESRVMLDMGLLHEEDLGRFLQAVEQNSPGLYRLDGCTLQRVSDSPRQAPNAVNVKARCIMRWITVNLPEVGA